MKLIYITNDPNKANQAQAAGIDRVMVDLEIIGKVARQGHLDTVISRHSLSDIAALEPILTSSELMVRINPLHEGSGEEIDNVIAKGAGRIMLPMFRSANEVQEIVDLIAGRVPLTLLLETGAALVRLPQIVAVRGIDDVHIGLNDLHIDLKLNFMFELFGSGLLENAANILQKAKVPFGIGGVANFDSGTIPAKLILSEHCRLGSSRVILSRSFYVDGSGQEQLELEVNKLRSYLAADKPLEENRKKMEASIQEIVASLLHNN